MLQVSEERRVKLDYFLFNTAMLLLLKRESHLVPSLVNIASCVVVNTEHRNQSV